MADDVGQQGRRHVVGAASRQVEPDGVMALQLFRQSRAQPLDPTARETAEEKEEHEDEKDGSKTDVHESSLPEASKRWMRDQGLERRSSQAHFP